MSVICKRRHVTALHIVLQARQPERGEQRRGKGHEQDKFDRIGNHLLNQAL